MTHASPPLPLAVVLFVAILCGGAETNQQPIDQLGPSGLVLHYTFDSHAGDVVANEAGSQHAGQGNNTSFANAQSAGSALIVRKGKVQSGYVETPDHDDLNAPNARFCFFHKPRSFS